MKQEFISQTDSNNSWPVVASQYELGLLIEKGNFASVYTGVCKSNEQKICIKIMDLENISVSLDKVLQEIQLMRLCNDPNILTYFTNFVHREQLWLISQLMNKGSSQRVLTFSKALELGEGFSEDCLSFILAETLKGLNYLHARSLIHRDVKASNILLDSRGSVLLSDLALSSATSFEVGQKAHTVVGSPSYMAPEVFEQEQSQNGYDARADIWSLGITALELAKGSPPFANLPAMKIIAMTLENDPPSLKSYPHERQLSSEGVLFSKNFEDFYKQCLQKNPKHRPSAAELLKHRLVRSCTPDALVLFLQKIPDIDDWTLNNQLPLIEPEGTNIAEVLEDFEDISGPSELRYEDGLKTPSRHHSHRNIFETSEYGTNPFLASSCRSRSQSSELVLPSPQRDNENGKKDSRTIDNSNSEEEGKERGEGEEDGERKTRSGSLSSYVPGTTWVFETSITRDEKGQFKTYEQIKEAMNKTNSNNHSNDHNTPTTASADLLSEDKEAINDFLDEFEASEATIKTQV